MTRRKTVAFIPLRGGSKSIPLKNIKNFCGKPLVYWTLKAATEVEAINQVVVATDSPEIRSVVAHLGFPKVEIYARLPENAQDSSSTESVMLEYLDQSDLAPSDVFILIQATSPLLSGEDLCNGLLMKEHADSVLSAVRTKRFFWSDEGKSLNYDYRTRPRRQDFHGLYMENGAFYVNTVGNILRDKNRLSGKIAICEMPFYTGWEIDEPDDWSLMESLMKRYILSRSGHDVAIKLVLSDVDGVLTDGGMYYSEKGDELKKFNTRDGMGFQILREHGFKTGIITSEETDIVVRRAKKLHVDFLMQGKRGSGKLAEVQELCERLKIDLKNVAYIGDDINCRELLEQAGLAACPEDAADEIRSIKNIRILSRRGGGGAFREFAEYIISEQNRI